MKGGYLHCLMHRVSRSSNVPLIYTTTAPSFEEFEMAVCAVISFLKGFPELAGARIAVIGGLGFLKCFQSFRTTRVSQIVHRQVHVTDLWKALISSSL